MQYLTYTLAAQYPLHLRAEKGCSRLPARVYRSDLKQLFTHLYQDLVSIQHLFDHTRLDTMAIYLHTTDSKMRDAVHAHPLSG